MSFASRQPTTDSRALHRALPIVASVIALLTVLLIMRTAPDPVIAGAGDPLRGEPGRQRHPEVFAPMAENRADDTPLAVDAGASDSPPRAQPAEPPAAAPTALPAEKLTAVAVVETFTGLAAFAPAVSSRAAARGAVMPAPPLPEAPPQVAAVAPAVEESRTAVPSIIPVADEMAAAPGLPVSPPEAAAALPLEGAENWQAYEEFTPIEPAAPPSLALVEDWQAYEEFPPTETAAPIAEPPADAVEIAAIEISGKPAARFERLDARGEPVAEGDPWACVRDNRTGLVWEVKTRGGGLRDAAHVYSWFDPLQDAASGARDGGRCEGGIDCDTHDYQHALNGLALCGFSDWRLPARDELQTLVRAGAGRSAATIDDELFPATLASWYWSASENDRRPDYAWYVLFRNGLPLNDLKSRPKHIRLVRGQRLLLASQQRHLDAD